jgi:hypothetical protein
VNNKVFYNSLNDTTIFKINFQDKEVERIIQRNH